MGTLGYSMMAVVGALGMIVVFAYNIFQSVTTEKHGKHRMLSVTSVLFRLFRGKYYEQTQFCISFFQFK